MDLSLSRPPGGRHGAGRAPRLPAGRRASATTPSKRQISPVHVRPPRQSDRPAWNLHVELSLSRPSVGRHGAGGAPRLPSGQTGATATRPKRQIPSARARPPQQSDRPAWIVHVELSLSRPPGGRHGAGRAPRLPPGRRARQPPGRSDRSRPPAHNHPGKATDPRGTFAWNCRFRDRRAGGTVPEVRRASRPADGRDHPVKATDLTSPRSTTPAKRQACVKGSRATVAFATTPPKRQIPAAHARPPRRSDRPRQPTRDHPAEATDPRGTFAAICRVRGQAPAPAARPQSVRSRSATSSMTASGRTSST